MTCTKFTSPSVISCIGPKIQAEGRNTEERANAITQQEGNTHQTNNSLELYYDSLHDLVTGSTSPDTSTDTVHGRSEYKDREDEASSDFPETLSETINMDDIWDTYTCNGSEDSTQNSQYLPWVISNVELNKGHFFDETEHNSSARYLTVKGNHHFLFTRRIRILATVLQSTRKPSKSYAKKI